MALTELHMLADSGIINQENIQDHFADINTSSSSLTPLHLALFNSRYTAVLFLIAFGADVNVKFHVVDTYSAITYAEEYRKDYLSILKGGAEKAKDELISKGLYQEIKYTKSAKH